MTQQTSGITAADDQDREAAGPGTAPARAVGPRRATISTPVGAVRQMISDATRINLLAIAESEGLSDG